MFSLISGVYQAYFAPPQLNILVVGPQGSGKTALLERIKVTQTDTKRKQQQQQRRRQQQQQQQQQQQNLVCQSKGSSAAAATQLSLRQLQEPPSPAMLPMTFLMERAVISNNADAMSGTTVHQLTELQHQNTLRRDSFLNHPVPSPGPSTVAHGRKTVVTPRRSWVCPRPNKNDDEADQDEEYMEMLLGSAGLPNLSPELPTIPQSPLSGDEIHPVHSNVTAAAVAAVEPDHSLPVPLLPRSSAPVHRSSTQGSMESVELNRDAATTTTTARLPVSTTAVAITPKRTSLQLQQQYDLKPGSKMLPLERIRPTIGMNLGKVEMCGAQCHVSDLGGRLQDLWERYYYDCDAVIFVWKVPNVITDDHGIDERTGVAVGGGEESDDDHLENDSDDGRPQFTAEQQLDLLEQVRGAIADDIPFLVLGHVFGKHVHVDKCNFVDLISETGTTASQYPYVMDVQYSTSQLLPHYHNPCQAFFFANAATGQGVRTAMEWLVPLAHRQQRLRDLPSYDVEK